MTTYHYLFDKTLAFLLKNRDVLILVCILLSLVLFLSGGMPEPVASGHLVDSPLPSPSLLLTTPTWTPPGPDWIATRKANMATEEAGGIFTPDPTYPTSTPTPTGGIDPEPTAFAPPGGTPAGAGFIVFDLPSFKIVPSMKQWQNTWVKNFAENRKQLVVWAGAEGRADLQPSHQGMIATRIFEMITEPVYKGFTFGPLDLYRTPIEAGAVRIIDAVGETLILQSTQGIPFYFDLPSRQFVPTIPGGTPTPRATGAATVTAVAPEEVTAP